MTNLATLWQISYMSSFPQEEHSIIDLISILIVKSPFLGFSWKWANFIEFNNMLYQCTGYQSNDILGMYSLRDIDL